ncbi:hypothetical protein QR46_0280 [Giardia duodenalis assemblage B]|uniref:Pre-mRNA polyadenylation factor Fip1 domain-containing protein n=3 Tax=Giardia intestinalis TaxID=5741 RepID=A0A132P046_GIAIN|nr:Hypothetical protein GL50581_4374 [Giardia intestinalis ATCC 50581]ESU44640.1 Hypothetical protein GSB_11114 [Giardia intestinalis]KWX15698.1 hypothetical protein QR46_0280 [Giardia intestinalis assemblage B]
MSDDRGATGLFIHDIEESNEDTDTSATNFSNAILNHPLRCVVPAGNPVVSNDIMLLKSLAESNAGPPSFNYGFDENTWSAYSTMHLCAACSLHNFRTAFNQWASRQRMRPPDVEGCFLALNETVGNIYDPRRERGYRPYRQGDNKRGDSRDFRRGDNRDFRRGDRGERPDRMGYHSNDPRQNRIKK